MTNLECVRILRNFNKWRRGEINKITEDNYTVGQAIDHAINSFKNSDYETKSTQN